MRDQVLPAGDPGGAPCIPSYLGIILSSQKRGQYLKKNQAEILFKFQQTDIYN